MLSKESRLLHPCCHILPLYFTRKFWREGARAVPLGFWSYCQNSWHIHALRSAFVGFFMFLLKQWRSVGILGWTRCWWYSCLLATFWVFYYFCGLFFLLSVKWRLCRSSGIFQSSCNSSHWQTELVMANIDTGWACAHGLSYVNTTVLLVTALTPCFLWKWLTRLNFQEVFHSLGILTPLTHRWLVDPVLHWLLRVDAAALCSCGVPGGEKSCEKTMGIQGAG